MKEKYKGVTIVIHKEHDGFYPSVIKSNGTETDITADTFSSAESAIAFAKKKIDADRAFLNSAIMKNDIFHVEKAVRGQCRYGSITNAHDGFNRAAEKAKSVNDQLYAIAKSLGATGGSVQQSMRGFGGSAGFKDEKAAKQFAEKAKADPNVKSIKVSSANGHFFVDYLFTITATGQSFK